MLAIDLSRIFSEDRAVSFVHRLVVQASVPTHIALIAFKALVLLASLARAGMDYFAADKTRGDSDADRQP